MDGKNSSISRKLTGFFMARLLSGAFAIATLTSCITPRLYIESNPMGVDVYAAHPEEKQRQLIGKTPLEISMDELSKKVNRPGGNNEYILVSFEGKQIEPQSFMVPLISVGMMKTSLKVNLSAKEEDRTAATILQRLHNAQKFAQARDFERAHQECDKILASNPDLVRAVSMKASLYYVQNRLDLAQTLYEKALEIDPNFDDAILMIAKIKQDRRR